MSEAGYSLEGLEHGIDRCKVNIGVLETAIEKERNTIKEYRIMIDSVETSDRLKKEAESNVHLEVVDDSP